MATYLNNLPIDIQALCDCVMMSGEKEASEIHELKKKMLVAAHRRATWKLGAGS